MTRANPFDDLDDLATPQQGKPVNVADIARIADEHGFPSRQPPAKPAAPTTRQRRRYTTGRNQQINVKATAATVELFYRLADERGCTLGELLEEALHTLAKPRAS
jgi:hypothetical protein